MPAGQANAAFQRLAVITGTHPNAFPSLGDLEAAWARYTATIFTPPPACRAATAFACCRRADVATD